MGWSLIEHDFDAVAGVPVADALLLVLGDRQVSPTVFCSSPFCPLPARRAGRPYRFEQQPFSPCPDFAREILRRQFRLHFRFGSAAASSFFRPACWFAGEKRQRAGAAQDAARGSEAIGKRVSVLDCPPSVPQCGTTEDGRWPSTAFDSRRGMAEPVAGRMEKFFRPPSP